MMAEQILGYVMLAMLFMITFDGCIACSLGTYEIVKEWMENRKNDNKRKKL